MHSEKSERPLLTVIVPCNDVSLLISRYPDIVKSCKDRKIEFIFVIDCLNSDEINIKSLQSSFHLFPADSACTIKFIYDTFGNPGDTRNAGVKLARGEWVQFCDSDDDPEIVNIANEIENVNQEYELCIFDFTVRDLGSKLEKRIKARSSLWTVAMNPGIWRIVFRNSILENVSFPPFRLGEDQCFLISLGLSSRRIKFVDSSAYTYLRGRPGQITSNSSFFSDSNDAFRFGLEKYLSLPSPHLTEAIMAGRLFMSAMKRVTIQKRFHVSLLLLRAIFGSWLYGMMLLLALIYVLTHRSNL